MERRQPIRIQPIRIGMQCAEFDNPILDGLILEMREASDGMDLDALVDRVRRVVTDYDAGGEGNGSVPTDEVVVEYETKTDDLE